MEINLFTENNILEQKKFLFIHVFKNLVISYSCFTKIGLYLKKIKNLNKNGKDIKEKNYSIEKVDLENRKDFDNSNDTYKSDLNIITDGFCS